MILLNGDKALNGDNLITIWNSDDEVWCHAGSALAFQEFVVLEKRTEGEIDSLLLYQHPQI